MTTIGIVLAAGRSSRFGEADKLSATFHGAPLAHYAAVAMLGAAVDHRIVVVRPAVDRFDGFDIVYAPEGAPQSESLKHGVRRAIAIGADRIVITLADMPLVNAALIDAVVKRAGTDGTAAATDGDRRAPPACFPASAFPALLALDGDRGAGQLLATLPDGALVSVTEQELADVDTPADLVALERALGG
ncbi:nucleotidyltransferase family protein [Aliiroseovarius sp. YM-037]|uniref:nucleotidyltransferase family protein n=1 Tax=Aliiroseovarius sp. YM-037 TaxID=3341728 RepID=UPI003A80D516